MSRALPRALLAAFAAVVTTLPLGGVTFPFLPEKSMKVSLPMLAIPALTGVAAFLFAIYLLTRKNPPRPALYLLAVLASTYVLISIAFTTFHTLINGHELDASTYLSGLVVTGFGVIVLWRNFLVALAVLFIGDWLLRRRS